MHATLHVSFGRVSPCRYWSVCWMCLLWEGKHYRIGIFEHWSRVRRLFWEQYCYWKKDCLGHTETRALDIIREDNGEFKTKSQVSARLFEPGNGTSTYRIIHDICRILNGDLPSRRGRHHSSLWLWPGKDLGIWQGGGWLGGRLQGQQPDIISELLRIAQYNFRSTYITCTQEKWQKKEIEYQASYTRPKVIRGCHDCSRSKTYF